MVTKADIAARCDSLKAIAALCRCDMGELLAINLQAWPALRDSELPRSRALISRFKLHSLIALPLDCTPGVSILCGPF